MNIYATNSAEGYEFQGSFESLGEAQAWAESHGQSYAYWWADEEHATVPDWVRVPLYAPLGA